MIRAATTCAVCNGDIDEVLDYSCRINGTEEAHEACCGTGLVVRVVVQCVCGERATADHATGWTELDREWYCPSCLDTRRREDEIDRMLADDERKSAQFRRAHRAIRLVAALASRPCAGRRIFDRTCNGLHPAEVPCLPCAARRVAKGVSRG